MSQSLTPRYKIEEMNSSLTITLPSKRDFFIFPSLLPNIIVAGLVSLIICSILTYGSGWFLLEFFNVSTGKVSKFLTPLDIVAFMGIAIFLGLLLCFVVYESALHLQVFLWELVGKEQILVTSDTLVLHQQIYRWRQVKKYESKIIRHMHLMPVEQNFEWFMWGSSLLSHYWLDNGAIGFNYRGEIIRFAIGAESVEATELLKAIWHKFPRYREVIELPE